MRRDSGLQPERTRLAWQRTGVAALLVAAGAGLAAAHREQTAVLLLAGVACAAAGAFVVAGGRLALAEAYPRVVIGATVAVLLALVGIALSLA